ncbi:hypothetical protein PCE1_004211 [Barthelona sp. PCE]
MVVSEIVGFLFRILPVPEVYVSMSVLVVVAIALVHLGSHLSDLSKKNEGSVQFVSYDSMKTSDVALFPIVAGAALTGLFVAMKFFGKELVNKLMGFYFFAVASISMAYLLVVLMSLRETEESIKESMWFGNVTMRFPIPFYKSVSFSFCLLHIIGFFLGMIISALYHTEKHWLLANTLAAIFTVMGIIEFPFVKYSHCAALLGLLFLYDIFFVYFTPIMISVASNLDLPIKLLFPRNQLCTEFSLLGLGDLVIPAMLLSNLRMSGRHYKKTLVAYGCSLFIAVFFAVYFKHGQPALLYIVPAILLVSTLGALIKGDFKEMVGYRFVVEDVKEEECGGSQEEAEECDETEEVACEQLQDIDEQVE